MVHPGASQVEKRGHERSYVHEDEGGFLVLCTVAVVVQRYSYC